MQIKNCITNLRQLRFISGNAQGYYIATYVYKTKGILFVVLNHWNNYSKVTITDSGQSLQ